MRLVVRIELGVTTLCELVEGAGLEPFPVQFPISQILAIVEALLFKQAASGPLYPALLCSIARVSVWAGLDESEVLPALHQLGGCLAKVVAGKLGLRLLPWAPAVAGSVVQTLVWEATQVDPQLPQLTLLLPRKDPVGEGEGC